MIGAHYYPWYGKKENIILGGGNWGSGIANNPSLGEYSSGTEEIIRQHVQMAKKAGISFFVLEWTGPGLHEDQNIQNHCIPVFESMDMPFCILYDSYFTLHKAESQPSWDLSDRYDAIQTKGEKMVKDFTYLSDTYFSHPLYVQVQSRPVVVIFVVYKYRDRDGYIRKIRMLQGMPKGGPFLIGDMVSAYTRLSSPTVGEILQYVKNTPLSDVVSRMRGKCSGKKDDPDGNPIPDLDALSGYNLLNDDGKILPNYVHVLQNLAKTGKKYEKTWIPFIFPGYDDRNLRGRDRMRYCIDRDGGEFYRKILELAEEYVHPDLNLVLLTSFNEWHEGTEIEPSEEYGDLYLDITAASPLAGGSIQTLCP